MHHVSLSLQCVYGCIDERGEKEVGWIVVRFLEKMREGRFPDLLYADDFGFMCQVRRRNRDGGMFS